MSQRIQDPWSINLIEFLIQKNFRFVNEIQEIQFNFQKMKKKKLNESMEKWMNRKWMSEWNKKSMNEKMNQWLNEYMDNKSKN